MVRMLVLASLFASVLGTSTIAQPMRPSWAWRHHHRCYWVWHRHHRVRVCWRHWR